MQSCKLYNGPMNGNIINIIKIKEDWNTDMWINIRNRFVVNNPRHYCPIGHATTITDFEVKYDNSDTEEYTVHKMSEYERELMHEMYINNYCVPKFITSIYDIEEIYEDPDISIWFILEVLHPCFVDEENYVIKDIDSNYVDCNNVLLDIYNSEYGTLLSKSSKLTCNIVKKYSKIIEWDIEYISSNTVLDIDKMFDYEIQVKLKYLLLHPKLTQTHFEKYNLEWYALNCASVLRSSVNFLEPYRVKYKAKYLKHKKTN
jgi:hypothetical protein